jgi:hypothetical protein
MKVNVHVADLASSYQPKLMSILPLLVRVTKSSGSRLRALSQASTASS